MKHLSQILITVLLFGAITSSAQKTEALDGFFSNAPSAAPGDAADVIIGDGLSVDKYLPVAPYWGYTYSQTIYLQREINVSGPITEIRYYYNGNTEWSDEVDVYMGTTTKSSYASETDWVPVSEMTLVYSGLLAVTTTEGWVSIMLDASFDYDNTSNLVVAVHEKSSGFHTDGDDFYCTEMVDEARSLAVVSDKANPDPASPPAAEDFTGWSPDFIPNTAFVFDNVVTDVDGNTYNIVTIGDQQWLDRNLQTTIYNDGTPIDNVTDGAAWVDLTTGAYAWYQNDEGYKEPYGALYNWHAVNSGKLCPEGWHVPTDAEWTALADYLGGSTVAGGKLKQKGITLWDDPNVDATDDFGFTAVPNGSRDGSTDGAFNSRIGRTGGWWTSTSSGDNSAYNRYVTNNGAGLGSDKYYMKAAGIGVRCLKDATTSEVSLPVVNTSNVTNIASSSATSGGEVVDNGGGMISARGVVWSTNENPSIDVNEGMTTDGSGIGSFTSDVIGLSAGTNYYVRAYATNEVGTAYGNQVTFSTVSAIDGITSTETGGNWNDPSTWIGGAVPGADDNVVINGPVSIGGNYSCNSLYVAQSGSIQNGNDLQLYSLEVNGDLLNEGVLLNNPDFSSTFMRVIVHGDVTNSATMSFGELALAGENGNTISQNGSSPFTVSELKMWFNATGPVTFGSDVSFAGTNIALSNVQATLAGRLNLYAGAGLSDVVLNGQGNILSGRDNAILTSVSLSNVNLQDNIQIVGNSVSFGTGVVIEGTVENGDEYQIYTLEATADFVNEGVLRNNPNFGTALNVSVLKNVTNSGIIGVQQFYVDGIIDQTITLMNGSGINSEVFFHSNMDAAGPYQWQKDGVDIAGATSDFLKFENGLTSADAGVFTCISDGTVSRTITVVAETSTVDALPLPFHDGFEAGTEGWLAYDFDEDGYTWGRFNDATEAYAGDHGLRVEWNASGNNDWLVSPLLEFPADEPVTLSFYAKSYDVNYLESFEVKVISEDGETIDHIASENDIPEVYNEYTYDLSAFAGQNVYFAVVCVSVDENYLYVDEFNVKAISFTSTPDVDHLDPSIAIYPNPVSEPSIVSIEVANDEITGVDLLNITGLIVKRYPVSGASGKVRINVNGQKPGVYFLRIDTINGTILKKILIQ